jgi:hypothetical protein
MRNHYPEIELNSISKLTKLENKNPKRDQLFSENFNNFSEFEQLDNN